jgi:hypothetical protein
MTRPYSFKGITDTCLSGHSTFDRQVDAACIMAGNVISDVQTSTYIRPRQQLECNGFTNAPGHLQEFDLKTFARRQDMGRVLAYIRADPFFASNDAIGYRIFHKVGKQETLHGFLLTDRDHQLIRRFDREDLGLRRSAKSASVLDFCLPYVALVGQPSTGQAA